MHEHQCIVSDLVDGFAEAVNSVAEDYETDLDATHVGTAFVVLTTNAGMQHQEKFETYSGDSAGN
jgi:hypothetical protein